MPSGIPKQSSITQQHRNTETIRLHKNKESDQPFFGIFPGIKRQLFILHKNNPRFIYNSAIDEQPKFWYNEIM